MCYLRQGASLSPHQILESKKWNILIPPTFTRSTIRIPYLSPFLCRNCYLEARNVAASFPRIPSLLETACTTESQKLGFWQQSLLDLT